MVGNSSNSAIHRTEYVIVRFPRQWIGRGGLVGLLFQRTLHQWVSSDGVSSKSKVFQPPSWPHVNEWIISITENMTAAVTDILRSIRVFPHITAGSHIDIL